MWLWLVILICLVSSCSTKQNTAMTRFYHSTTARFNILYNGQVAYQEGLESQINGHKDDYTQLLPMYTPTNKSTAGMGKSNFETAILKSQKAIKLHSIKRKPVIKPNKRKTEKQKALLQRKEYNPYMYHAWLMMAESQFRMGEFLEAAATYNYITRLYQGQPSVVSIARARLAQCYVAVEWPYDAEDVLRKMDRDTITHKGMIEYDNAKAAYLIQTEQYQEAIPYLKRTIKHQRGSVSRARLNYLLGQLYHKIGDSQNAYKSLTRVIRANPPYEMSLNARVLQTEVIGKKDAKGMIRKLRRMARNENNKDYLDQIYMAIGNIYLNIPDTLNCIYAWEKGIKESTQSGHAKAELLLRAANLYWDMEKYIDAARCYKECVGILDKKRDEFKETERRSKALEPLAPHLETIKLQDSLQILAKMPEKEYLAVIDRVIKELKKKEKEESRRQDAAQARAEAQATARNNAAAAGNRTGAGNRQTTWYFYNPATVTKGKEDFQRRWGQRKNEDDWRRSNKVTEAFGEDSETDYTQENDSLFGAAIDDENEEEKALKDSLANDPHHREYYLKQIPFTEEQMEESNQLIYDALYNAGIMEQEKIENFTMARKTLGRLIESCPDYKEMEDVYYHMFLILGRMGLTDEAEAYRQKVIELFPEGKRGLLLGNPDYEMIARGGRHLEDSVYAATYNSYVADDYGTVMQNYEFSTKNYPEGPHRARFMFIHAMSQLYTGDKNGFLESLKELVEKFGSEELAKLAEEILKGIKEGRLLSGEKLGTNGLWSRRTRADRQGEDAQEIPELSENRDGNYAFVLAYPTGALDEDQLLFEMARYNFTAFLVRNFDLEFAEQSGISMLIVKGFLGYDEVHTYAQQLFSDRHMATTLDGIRVIMISEDNLKLLGTEYSFDDYKEFYDEKIAPIEIPEDLKIDENQQIENIDPDDAADKEAEEEEYEEDEDDFPFGF